MSNAERPMLNVEVGKLDPSVSRHTSLGFCLPAAGRLSAFARLFYLTKTRSRKENKMEIPEK
jgi:hypothetical protein